MFRGAGQSVLPGALLQGQGHEYGCGFAGLHSEGIGDKGMNRQVPGAPGREVPSQKV